MKIFMLSLYKQANVIDMTPSCFLHPHNLNKLGRYCIPNKGSSVLECLNRDRGAAGSSLTDVTVLCT